MKTSRKLTYVVIFLALSVLIFLYLQQTARSVWLEGFKYRYPIEITEIAGLDLKDHQVRIKLTSKYFDFSKTLKSGNDVRFADEDGQLLHFWIERWPDGDQSGSESEQEAVIWVKIPRLKPFEKKKIYMYYGNSDATTYSNIQNTMEFAELIKSKVASTPVELEFSFEPDLVLSSPPIFEGAHFPASVQVFKEDRTFKAVIEKPSYGPSESTEATVYFLGIKSGTFSYPGVRIHATTASVDSFVSPLTDTKQSAVLIESVHGQKRFSFLSINDRPSDNAQLRFLYPAISDSTPYGLAAHLLMEPDNTESDGKQVSVAAVSCEVQSGEAFLYEATRNIYKQVLFSTTTTVETTLTLPPDHVYFVSVEKFTNDSIFPVLVSERSDLRLVLGTENEEQSYTTKTINIFAFPETGIYVLARSSYDEPLVSFSRIKGRIFEDANLNKSFDAGERVFEGAKVRLYEDTDGNHRIDPYDRFIMETETDGNGIYSLPALENKKYLIAVSALSCAESVEESADATVPVLPEGYFAAGYLNGNRVLLEKAGGEDPNVSDYWSENPDPVFNIYEHVIPVEFDESEEISGIDYGFSFSLVTNTEDSELPSQGSLRQAIYNSNLLRGRQEIRFYLTDKTRNYFELLNEYQIDLAKELPPLMDAADISGLNLDPETKESEVVLRGSENNLEYCFKVLAPGTKIRNLKISGFRTGVEFEVPQFERIIGGNEGELTEGFYASETAEASLELISKDDFSILPSIKFKSLLDSTASVFPVFPLNSSDFSIVERKNPAAYKNYINLNLVKREGAIGVGRSGAVFSGKKGKELVISNTQFKLHQRGAFRIADSVLGRFITSGISLNFISERGIPEVPLKYAAKKIIVPAIEGSELIVHPYGNESSDSSVTFHYGIDVSETTSTSLPLKYAFSEKDRVISLESSSKMLAMLKTDSCSFPLPQASTMTCGIFKDGLLIASDKKSQITVYVTDENGRSTTIHKSLEPGISYDLYAEVEESGLSGWKSAVIVSSEALSSVGIIKDGKTSYVPFVPENLLDSRYFSLLDNEKIVVSAFSGTDLRIVRSGTIETLRLDGTLTESRIIKLENTRGNFSLESSVPLLVLAKERITGTYYIPAGLNDGYMKPEKHLSGARYPLDSGCSVKEVSFLACDVAIWVKEGTGIEAYRNNYINCNETIELGAPGKEPIDDTIQVDAPNLGVDRPTITYAVFEEPTLTVKGYVGSTESATFDMGRVELYISDSSGHPYIYLGETTVTGGLFEFSTSISSYKITFNDFVTAVFTFKDGSTSEFSLAERIDPAPVISNVSASHITPVLVDSTETLTTTITWYTDIPATSKVVYDVFSRSSTETYAFETTETTELVTTHTVVIEGLQPNTIYYFRVISKNEYGDQSISYEFMIPPGKTIPDTDLCAACHRAHTSVMRPLRLPFYVRE